MKQRRKKQTSLAHQLSSPEKQSNEIIYATKERCGLSSNLHPNVIIAACSNGEAVDSAILLDSDNSDCI